MAIVLVRMMVIGGKKRDERTSRSTYMSLSSSAPDFEVREKGMSILAILGRWLQDVHWYHQQPKTAHVSTNLLV